MNAAREGRQHASNKKTEATTPFRTVAASTTAGALPPEENKVGAGSPIAWLIRHCVGLKQRLIRDGSFGCDWADTLFRFYTRRIPNDGVAAPLASPNYALPAQKEEGAQLASLGPLLDKGAHGSEG